MGQQKTQWFVGTICRCPTNYSTPFRIAIEATDRDHASSRLYKLYDDYYDRSAVSFTAAQDTDEIHGARLHPMPTQL